MKNKDLEVGLDISTENETKVEDSNVAHLETELKKSQDKYLLLYADFENYKKRVQKEREELLLSTKSKMLNSILDLDNDLYIAKKNIGDSEGIKIIFNKVGNFLKSQGVEEIQTQTYDSDLHEVIQVLQTGEEKIIDVVSKGYSIDGKPFRYPKIILSK
jgi:molecular chaperone GrpE